MSEKFKLSAQLTADALKYHSTPRPGKTEVISTKPCATQRDLSLAYSPGVAAPCLEIQRDEKLAYEYTNKGNLVAVISNGTAVLGLGNIGAVAGKPVMEGKGILFKKFAGIDVFDIEIDETDIDKFVDVVASLEPTFGAVNLEDIKAPECFAIERKLCERMSIPVFHDDQHGTAIVVASGVTNALKIVDKKFESIKVVVSGAGAAAIACTQLLVDLGVKKSNVFVCDSKGVINTHRTDQDRMDETKKQFLQDTRHNTLSEAMEDADLFLGLSGPGTVDADDIMKMATNPIIFALANPTPEIMPEIVRKNRPDAIMGTGRSDYPNQVNNALCFPYIFRGALDVGATCINKEMKIATVNALARLATLEPHELVSSAYPGEKLSFGKTYLIPKPFDPRLITSIAPAVAKAAMDSGVANKPIQDMEHYIKTLEAQVFKSNMFMRPIFASAKADPKRIILCAGEDERVLRAITEINELGLARITVIGRPYVIKSRIEKLGLKLVIGEHFDVVNTENDKRYKECWTHYHNKMKRQGINEDSARHAMKSNHTLIAATLIELGYADGMICGLIGKYHEHFKIIRKMIGYDNPQNVAAAMNALIIQKGNIFITDTFVNENPNAEELAQITIMASDRMKAYGLEPKVALLSHSNFGSHMESVSAIKMRNVLNLVKAQEPSLIIDGEMHGDCALEEDIRRNAMPDSPIQGTANLLVMPNIESANISYNLMRVSSSDGITVGPILLGIKKSAHIISPISSTRRIVNMVAVATVDAQHKN